jgi:hypothetical protein
MGRFFSCSFLLAGALCLGVAGCSSAPVATDNANAKGGAVVAKEESKGVLGGLFETKKDVTIPEGTALHVTVDQTLASDRNHAGDSFAASTSEPVIVSGKVIIPKGAKVVGRIVDAKESGRLHAPARLAVALSSIEVQGKSYDLHSSTYRLTGKSHQNRNLGFIGGGAAGGALIGGLAGGGKGALIGSAVGAGAGTAGAAATGKKEIAIPAETRLNFKLVRSVTVSVKD